MYEDDGVTERYLGGEYALTDMSMIEQDGEVIVRIAPRKGSYEGMPEKRTYSVNIMNRSAASRVTVNGQETEFAIRTDGWCAKAEKGFVSVRAEESGEPLEIRIR